MPPKQKGLPAPIDRPLSRAYLREFTGWSTAFPPGLSEPTSLRVMENMSINRDGSIKVRPGLRNLTYNVDHVHAMIKNKGIVGAHELFFLNDGTKAYLFARREMDDTVKFYVARDTGNPAYPFEILNTTDAAVGLGTHTPFAADTTYVRYLQIDNKILALSNGTDTSRLFYVGATKKSINPVSITVPAWSSADKALVYQPKQPAIDDPAANKPNANWVANADRTLKTLLPKGADADDVDYSIGYYYTFENEYGESAPSQVKVIKVRRPHTAWRWQTPNASMEPSGDETDVATTVADQLFIYPSNAAFTTAKAQGALRMLVYAVMWSDQDAVPVQGMCIGERAFTPTLAYNDAWVRHTPEPPNDNRVQPLPTLNNLRNYSQPPKAAQGVVAGDRMILVNDVAEGAVIRWTTNRAGQYTTLTAARGGGYKTLTSGNLYIPAAVKLWQNPESKDTLTILCLGVDGYSTSFYMAPATVQGQTETTQIFGFEETTATPGTVAPFGVEVLNNALFHPLEEQLMKTTAANYNINHKTMTELIANEWISLIDKGHIVSSQHDNRIYYLVHNPEGEALEAGCWGNEVWVFDTAAKTGTWSRWLVQGCSLRKVEIEGRIAMSITRPDGIFAFDEARRYDEYIDPATRNVLQRSIPWKLETNTQGANRAHDAWAHLQQISLTLGNWSGKLRYGVRGYDLHGKAIDVSKVAKDAGAIPAGNVSWDVDDHLAVRRDLKEWRFYAESVTEGGVVQPGTGLINLVQYRYTPVSVNVGYEYGSVETFEYGRDVAGLGTNTINGVPVPALDMRRP